STPLPQGCLSATVELRGRSDVNDELALADATNLILFLRRRGLVAGDPGPLPPLACTATPLTGMESVRAPAGGVLSYRAAPGDRLRPGQVVADLIDPAADNPAEGRREVQASVEGVMFARRAERF